MSCGAACVRQLLLDAKIDVPEATIRELAGFDADFGIMLDGLKDALETLRPGVTYAHGAISPEQLDDLASLGPFIALLRTPSRHYVIVDEVGSEDVRVRDPAGTAEDPLVGAVAVLERTAFIERWTRAYHGVVFQRA